MWVMVEGAGAGGADFCIERGNKPPGSPPPGLPKAARGPLICLSAPRKPVGIEAPMPARMPTAISGVRRGAEQPRGRPSPGSARSSSSRV